MSSVKIEFPERMKTHVILAIAGLGGLLYGVDFGVISAAEPYLMSLGLYSGGQVSLEVERFGVLYFVVSFFIPETKGKNLDELEHLFERKK